jgi:hypothetical protein
VAASLWIGPKRACSRVRAVFAVTLSRARETRTPIGPYWARSRFVARSSICLRLRARSAAMKWLPIVSEKASILRLRRRLGRCKGADYRPQVLHSSVVNAPKALRDGFVASRPLANTKVDWQQFFGEGEHARALDLIPRVATPTLDTLKHLAGAFALPGVQYLFQEGVPVLEVPIGATRAALSSWASSSIRTASTPPAARARSPTATHASGGVRVSAGIATLYHG